VFPLSQVGQTSAGEVKTRDLRAELLAAEQEAKNKKRKAEGKPPLAVEDSSTAPVDEEANKRRKLLQEALELDRDDDDEKDGENSKTKDDEGDDDERCVMVLPLTNTAELKFACVRLAKKTLTTRKTIQLSFSAN
jgi:hypothetical protein